MTFNSRNEGGIKKVVDISIWTFISPSLMIEQGEEEKPKVPRANFISININSDRLLNRVLRFSS